MGMRMSCPGTHSVVPTTTPGICPREVSVNLRVVGVTKTPSEEAMVSMRFCGTESAETPAEMSPETEPWMMMW